MSETDKHRVRVALRHLGESSTLEVAERSRFSTQLTLSCLKSLQKEGKVGVRGRKWIEIPDGPLFVLLPHLRVPRSDQDGETMTTRPSLCIGLLIGVAVGVVLVLSLLGLGVLK